MRKKLLRSTSNKQIKSLKEMYYQVFKLFFKFEFTIHHDFDQSMSLSQNNEINQIQNYFWTTNEKRHVKNSINQV